MCVTFDKIKEGVYPNARKATDSVEMDSNTHTQTGSENMKVFMNSKSLSTSIY